MTMPASKRNVRVKYATAGVGIGPVNAAVKPAAAKPASRADSNI